MLTAFPKGRKAAFVVSIGVVGFYVITLLQALNWQDGERFITQLVVAPFAVAFWGGIAFVAGALIDRLGRKVTGASPAPRSLRANVAYNSPSVARSGKCDPFAQAGREVLTGNVLPDLWARSLAAAGSNELALKAEYVRLRVAQLGAMASDSPFDFTDQELEVYGRHQLEELARVLREGKTDSLRAVRNAICNKIGRDTDAPDDRPFLEAYYVQLQARLNRSS